MCLSRFEQVVQIRTAEALAGVAAAGAVYGLRTLQWMRVMMADISVVWAPLSMRLNSSRLLTARVH